MSASSLLANLVGDEDDFDYEEDDYYDEECEDLYSPYAEPPPVMPEVEVTPPVEIERKPVPTEYKFCSICSIEILKDDFPLHEQSKKHRGALVAIKVTSNQEKARAEKERLEKEGTERFQKTFTDKIIELIFGFIPPSQLLSLRLVCKKWKNYLDRETSWVKQYFLHFGEEIFLDSCYSGVDFPLLKLGINYLIDSEIAMEKFLKIQNFQKTLTLRFNYYPVFLREMDIDKSTGEVTCNVDNYSEILKQFGSKFASLSSELVYLEFPDLSESITPEYSSWITEVMKSVCENLSQNRNTDSLELKLSPFIKVTANPLIYLEGSRRIRSLVLSDSWFSYLKTNNEHGAVEREELEEKQSFTFNNISVTSLSIVRSRNSFSFSDVSGKYLFQALDSNSHLEVLNISNLNNVRGKKLFRRALENFLLKNHTLKELDLSGINVAKVDWSALAHNNALETLKLAKTALGTLNVFPLELKKNDSLLHLDVSNSLSNMNQTKGLHCLPSTLKTLNLSQNAFRPGNIQFVNLEKYLPNLITLDVTNCGAFSGISDLSLFIANTISLRCLRVFKGSGVPSVDIYSLSKAFGENESIVECDHLEAPENVFHEADFITAQLKRNNRKRAGRRTKAIR